MTVNIWQPVIVFIQFIETELKKTHAKIVNTFSFQIWNRAGYRGGGQSGIYSHMDKKDVTLKDFGDIGNFRKLTFANH